MSNPLPPLPDHDTAASAGADQPGAEQLAGAEPGRAAAPARSGPASPWATPPPPPPPPGALPPPDPWAVSLNTGVPASLPPGTSPWEPASDHLPRYGSVPSRSPGFGPPDPAAVSGPPWPALVASGSYTPPPLIRWPIVAGIAALAVYIVVIVALSTTTSAPGTTTPVTASHAVWLAHHDVTINALNRDQRALRIDNPASGGRTAKWVADWRRFHNDAVTAASLPNPGGSATVPWREMLNDYANGSSEYVQAILSHNDIELNQAARDILAGDGSAQRFNQAMGIGVR